MLKRPAPGKSRFDHRTAQKRQGLDGNEEDEVDVEDEDGADPVREFAQQHLLADLEEARRAGRIAVLEQAALSPPRVHDIAGSEGSETAETEGGEGGEAPFPVLELASLSASASLAGAGSPGALSNPGGGAGRASGAPVRMSYNERMQSGKLTGTCYTM